MEFDLLSFDILRAQAISQVVGFSSETLSHSSVGLDFTLVGEHNFGDLSDHPSWNTFFHLFFLKRLRILYQLVQVYEFEVSFAGISTTY